MTTREVLVAARALIDTPEKWTKDRAYALDSVGHRVSSYNDDAVAFCVDGAAARAVDDETGGSKLYDQVRQALKRALPAGYERSIWAFNDDPATTHADVLALFDAAIAAQPDAEVGDA